MKQSTTATDAARALASAGMLSVCTGVQEPSASDVNAAASIIDEVFDVERELTRNLSAEKRQRALERVSNGDATIKVGDRVRIEFWPMKNDLCGDVVYVPVEPGDSWIVRAEGRLFYVQHFATLSKRSPNDFGDDDDYMNSEGGIKER